MTRASSARVGLLRALLACGLTGMSARGAMAQADAAATTTERTEQSERITCSIAAAIKYAVPANLVLAVAEVEGGKPGQWVVNRNGSYDVGPMQLNTSYLRELARYGITPDDVAAAGCYAYELATWRLARHLARDHGDLWQRAANYHSRTPTLNAKYRAKLMARAASWASWLKTRYVTREFEAPAAVEQTPPAAAIASRKANSAAITVRRSVRRRVAQPGAAITATRRGAGRGRATWVQTSDVHLSPDELLALHAAP